MVKKVVTISAPARLHFGLIAMSVASTRMYGGAGLAIDQPDTVVSASQSSIPEPAVMCENADNQASISQLLRQAGLRNVEVKIHRTATAHSGFGSGTTVALAVLEAAFLACGCKLSPSELIKHSARGGTSGIGVQTYFEGGFIVDLGKIRARDEQWLPSQASLDSRRSSHRLTRLNWPRHWQLATIAPRNMNGLSGSAEVAFFNANTPISEVEAALVSNALCFELPGAICDESYDALRIVFRKSRQHGFKRCEVARLPSIQNFIDVLDIDLGFAATMSSLGPTIVAVLRSDSEAAHLQSALPTDWTYRQCRGQNTGRHITIADSQS